MSNWLYSGLSFEELVMERLAECALDMGLKQAWAMPPSSAIVADAMPCAYHFYRGTFAAQNPNAGRLVVPRQYVQRIVIAPIQEGSSDLDSDSELYRKGTHWFTRAHAYYFLHRELQTTHLPPLRYCVGIVPGQGTAPIVEDSGLIKVPAPNGEDVVALDLVLNIVMTAGKESLNG